MDKTAAAPVAGQAPQSSGRFWPEGWWRLMEFRIGIIPLPVFIVMGALIAGFVATGKISSEISMAIVVFSFFGFTVRRARQAHPGHPQYRRGGDLRHIHPVGAGLLQGPAGTDHQDDDGVHEVVQLSVSVHRFDHRRQHPQHESQGADQGLHQDLRPARDRLDRGDDRGNAGRHRVGAGDPPHVFLHRRAHHGRRRRGRRHSALGGLRRDPPSGSGRAVRNGIAAGDAGEPHRDSCCPEC